MPHVNIQRSVEFPSALFETALESILEAVAAQQGPWRDFALHLNLDDLGLPDVGHIAVPIHLTSKKEDVVAAAQQQIAVRIEAARHPESFPVFTGALGVNATNASRSTVWFDGTYEVPLNAFGEFIDAIGLRGKAEKVLNNFLDDIITGCDARINKSEQDFMRYQLLWRGK